jgi:hypothetical protein
MSWPKKIALILILDVWLWYGIFIAVRFLQHVVDFGK